MGRFALARGETAQAEDWFTRAPEKTYGDTSGFALLAGLAKDRGDTQGMLDWEARGVAADDAASLVRHGVSRFQSHGLSAALPFIRRGAEAGSAHGMYLMGLASRDLGQRAEAVEWLKQAVGQGHPQAQEKLGKLTG